MFNKYKAKLFVGDTWQETVRHQTGTDRHRHKDGFRLNNKQTNDNPKTTN